MLPSDDQLTATFICYNYYNLSDHFAIQLNHLKQTPKGHQGVCKIQENTVEPSLTVTLLLH